MKEVKFKKESQKKLKGLSKVIYIIAKIGKVLTIIGALGIIICMSLTPTVIKNIKIENDSIEIFNEKFIREDNKLIDQNHKEIVIEEENLDFVIHAIKNSNVLNTTYIELLLLTVLIVTILEYFVFRYLDKLFTNIYKEDTPFTLENVANIKKIAYFMIAILISPSLMELLTQITTGEEINININITNALYILIIYTISYVFEYGYEIQNGSLGGEIDE